jgi:predicted DNA-binding protein
MVKSWPAMEKSKLFDLEARRYCRSKNLTVRVPPERRQRLELIAAERHWQISQMVNRMIENFIEEYEKLPKAKQTTFEFDTPKKQKK